MSAGSSPASPASAYLGGRPIRAIDETRIILAFGLACGALLYVTWRAGIDLGVAWLLLIPLAIALAAAKERWLRSGVRLLDRVREALEAGDLDRAQALLVHGATGRYATKQVAIFLKALAGIAQKRGDAADAEALLCAAAALTK
jgi:prepilin signal peptidase PulO-like enzyme (type II secretory pathway)